MDPVALEKKPLHQCKTDELRAIACHKGLPRVESMERDHLTEGIRMIREWESKSIVALVKEAKIHGVPVQVGGPKRLLLKCMIDKVWSNDAVEPEQATQNEVPATPAEATAQIEVPAMAEKAIAAAPPSSSLQRIYLPNHEIRDTGTKASATSDTCIDGQAPDSATQALPEPVADQAVQLQAPSPPQTPPPRSDAAAIPDGGTPERVVPNVAAACNAADDEDSELKLLPDYVEVWGDNTLWCNVCQVQAPLRTIQQHLAGQRHASALKKLSQADAPPDPRPETTAAEKAAAVEKANAVEESDLEMLPDYVELQGSSVLWCGLCDVKTNLHSMKQHLCGDRHSKACRKKGWPELLYVEHFGHLQELTTGVTVARSKDAAQWRERCTIPSSTEDRTSNTPACGSTEAPADTTADASVETGEVSKGTAADAPVETGEVSKDVAPNDDSERQRIDPWMDGLDPWSNSSTNGASANPSGCKGGKSGKGSKGAFMRGGAFGKGTFANANGFSCKGGKAAVHTVPFRTPQLRPPSLGKPAATLTGDIRRRDGENAGHLSMLLNDLDSICMRDLVERACHIWEAFPPEARLILTDRGPANLTLFRGHICRHIEFRRQCHKGDRCTFAHTYNELLKTTPAQHLRAAAQHMQRLQQEATASKDRRPPRGSSRPALRPLSSGDIRARSATGNRDSGCPTSFASQKPPPLPDKLPWQSKDDPQAVPAVPTHAQTEEDIDDSVAKLREGQVMIAKKIVTEPPTGWSAENFLVPVAPGQAITIDIIEEDWLWGSTEERSGWVHTSVLIGGET